MKFTDRFIASLKPQPKKYTLNEGRGFQILVLPTGTKTFYIRYTFAGKEKTKALGVYPEVGLSEARGRYSEVLLQLRAGIDPSAKEIVSEEDITVEWIAKRYIKWADTHLCKDWASIIEGTINKHVLPVLGKRTMISIRKREAIQFMESIPTAGAARNVLKVIGGMYDYATQREFVDSSPFTKLTRAVPALKPESRERTLNEREIKLVWEELGKWPTNTALALRFILVTGQRPGEVIGTHTREIDGEWWTIPADRMKNKKIHRVFLTKTALRLIEKREGYVFPTPLADTPLTERSLPQMVSRKVKYYGLERWTPHDLRRTVRTMLAKVGVIDEHAEAVISHTKQGIVGVYNQYQYDKEKRAALIKWEKELKRIIKSADPQPTV